MPLLASSAAVVVRGIVIDVLERGDVVVGVTSPTEKKISCDSLESSDIQLSSLAIGDHVLVFCPENESERGVVLGRITRGQSESGRPHAKTHLSVGAAESLTLTCGESSLQLRKDGKVMILGKDILTRAKRTARIKGGSVAIN